MSVRSMKKMTRHEQKEKTKVLLLQKAYQEFAERGIQATNTLHISQSANVGHGTIFAHFATRDDLLRAVVEEFGMKLGSYLAGAQAREGDLKEVLREHLRMIREYEPFYTRLIKERDTLPSAVKTQLTLIQSGIAHHLSVAIERNFKTSSIRSFPLAMLLNTWLGLLHYYLMQNDLFAPGKSVIDAKGEELLEYYITLITNP